MDDMLKEYVLSTQDVAYYLGHTEVRCLHVVKLRSEAQQFH